MRSLIVTREPYRVSLGDFTPRHCFVYSRKNKFVLPRPENGRLFIKQRNGYIIGKIFSRSTHWSYYRRAILKRGQVDFFSHKRPGARRLLTSCPCNNMDTPLECPLLHLHPYTIKNTETSNLAKSTFFTLHRHWTFSLTSLPFKTTWIHHWNALSSVYACKKKYFKKRTFRPSPTSTTSLWSWNHDPVATLFTLASPGLK